MSPADAEYLSNLKQSIREKDEQRTSGERAFTLMLVALIATVALLGAVLLLQRAAWVKVGLDQGPKPTVVRHAGPVGQV